MNDEKVFLDTWFVLALLNKRDNFHARAKSIYSSLPKASELWITEAIIVEIGNAVSAYNRSGAVAFIHVCYRTRNMQVVSVDTPLLMRATDLYSQREDKEWGLTDCISFVVMQENGLVDALTGDHHFEQAGFRALLRE
jgi:predicted nucleic acid-binding protein